MTRVYKLNPGDILVIRSSEDIQSAKIGKLYKNYPAIVQQVFYKPKPWYQFWKRKEIEEIHIQWLG